MKLSSNFKRVRKGRTLKFLEFKYYCFITGKDKNILRDYPKQLPVSLAVREATSHSESFMYLHMTRKYKKTVH